LKVQAGARPVAFHAFPAIVPHMDTRPLNIELPDGEAVSGLGKPLRVAC